LAAFQYEFAYSNWHFLMQIRYLLDRIPNAILFGSDWPFVRYSPLPSHKQWVAALRNISLPEPFLKMGMSQISDAERKKILGGNAGKLLGIL
jgi:predicted TIM-barrel fold metal-dependent hydrolase